MSEIEFNKIFAAILIAGITAMLAGFVADVLIHPHELEEDVVAVEGGPVEGGGPAKAAGPDPILHLIATADVAQGEKLSKACAACHSFDQGGANMVGPNLWGVVGRDKAAVSGFSYSAGMSASEGAWTYDSLNKFLWKPKAYIGDTKMNYIGLKKPEDRAAIIAWLRTLGSNAPLPTDAEIAAEKAELAPEPEAGAGEGMAPATETGEASAAEAPGGNG